MRRLGGARGALAVLALLTVTTSSCTAIVKLDDHGDVTNRCITDLDCSSKNAGSACGPNHTCVAIDGYCATNKQCIERAGSETYFCQKGATPAENKCKALLGGPCTGLMAEPGDVANDDMIVLGLPWMTWTPVLHSGEDGVNLARKDFHTALGGLPAIPGHTTPRPIVVVVCEIPLSSGEDAALHAAIDHLVDIKVPATIGPLIPDWIDYAVTKGAVNKMAVLTTDSAAGQFQGDTKGRLLTNGNPDNTMARPLIVAEHEKILRSLGKTDDVKVALMTTGLAADSSYGDYFYQHLTFNGKSALDNGPNYREFDYGDVNGPGSPQLASAVADLVAWKPDIVALNGWGNEYAIDAIETAGLHPRYAVSPGESTVSLATFLDGQPDGVKRILGERPGRPTTDHRLAAFINRFAATFPEDQGQYGLGVQNYDLFYYIAYGMASLPADKPIVGEDIGNAILHRFVPGAAAASCTPASIISTVQKLQTGANVDMDGTGTIGDFDSTGNLLYSEMTIWCFDPDTKLDNRTKDSGLTFRTDKSELQGSLTCF